MNRIAFSTGILALLATAAVAAPLKPPERTVEGSTVTSERDPAVRITLPDTVQYVGADRWELYDVADCEIHVFVEADERKRVQKLYWIQFDAYLPGNTYQYDYLFADKVRPGGLLFDAQMGFGRTADPPKPRSEQERVNLMLLKKGYRLPDEAMNIRLVHLPDEEARKELMIIYAEDLGPAETTVEELSTEEGKAKWEKLQAELKERALESIKIEKGKEAPKS